MNTNEIDPLADILVQNNLNTLAETTDVEIREPIVLFSISTASLYNFEDESHIQEGQTVFHFN